ncbi:MAG: hypothetical protein KDD62_13060 [Bdellovibrionales bacterium]|nr:hypothetical protein [Bdellovibrionales bacterium]
MCSIHYQSDLSEASTDKQLSKQILLETKLDLASRYAGLADAFPDAFQDVMLPPVDAPESLLAKGTKTLGRFTITRGIEGISEESKRHPFKDMAYVQTHRFLGHFHHHSLFMAATLGVISVGCAAQANLLGAVSFAGACVAAAGIAHAVHNLKKRVGEKLIVLRLADIELQE